MLDKQKLKAFYIPLYSPSEKEVKEIIEEQGSFSINELQVHDSIAGVNKAVISPKKFNSQALLQNELTKNPRVFLALSLERQS